MAFSEARYGQGRGDVFLDDMKFSVMEVKQHCLSATIVNCSCITVVIGKMLASNVIVIKMRI